MKSWTVTPEEKGISSFKYVSRILPSAPAGLLRKSMRKKNITLNGKKMEGKEKLKAGDEIGIWFSEETIQKFVGEEKEKRGPAIPNFSSFIVYEDSHILILNKPAGLLSQRDAGEGISLNDGVLDYLHARVTSAFHPSICNRLDRNTSGLVMAGKDMDSLQQLNEVIRERRGHKFYEALVWGETEEQGILKGYMRKDTEHNRVSYSDTPVPGTYAVETRFIRKQVFEKEGVLLSLVQVELITGKSHQIRVHFAHAGHPLLGDAKYGTKESIQASHGLHLQRQMLHACRLVFPEMKGELAYLSGKTFEAALPEDMKKVIPL